MYDKSAMDNVNLWLEEQKTKNAEKAKNNEIDCESLDGDWETPADIHVKHMRAINEFNAQKTTKMQSVNEDGWYDDAPDECVDLDRPANVSSHDKGYEMRMNAHYKRMRERNNKRNGVREVAAPVEKKEVKADVKPIKPIYFVIMAILYILYKSATMLHLL